MELILVRHGETEENIRGMYIGWSDVPLNENGQRQACLAKDKLKEEPISRIFCSPLKRAADTAKKINLEHGIDIEYIEKLKERNFGIWECLTWSEIKNQYPSEYDLLEKDWKGYCITDGESSKMAYDRVVSFINELLAVDSDEVILIVSHSGCIRMIISYLLGLGIEGDWRFKIDNGKITKININSEKYAYLTLLNG